MRGLLLNRRNGWVIWLVVTSMLGMQHSNEQCWWLVHQSSCVPRKLTVAPCPWVMSHIAIFLFNFLLGIIQTSYHKLSKLQFPFRIWVFKQAFLILHFFYSPLFWFNGAKKKLLELFSGAFRHGDKIILLSIPFSNNLTYINLPYWKGICVPRQRTLCRFTVTLGNIPVTYGNIYDSCVAVSQLPDNYQGII